MGIPYSPIARDLGLQLPASNDGAGVHLREVEVSSLIEAERVEVVVRGDEPQAATARFPSHPANFPDESGPDTVPLIGDMQGEHLAGISVDDVREHTRETSPILGDQRRLLPSVDELAEPSHLRSRTIHQEACDQLPVRLGLFPLPNDHTRLHLVTSVTVHQSAADSRSSGSNRMTLKVTSSSMASL